MIERNCHSWANVSVLPDRYQRPRIFDFRPLELSIEKRFEQPAVLTCTPTTLQSLTPAASVLHASKSLFDAFRLALREVILGHQIFMPF